MTKTNSNTTPAPKAKPTPEKKEAATQTGNVPPTPVIDDSQQYDLIVEYLRRQKASGQPADKLVDRLILTEKQKKAIQKEMVNFEIKMTDIFKIDPTMRALRDVKVISTPIDPPKSPLSTPAVTLPRPESPKPIAPIDTATLRKPILDFAKNAEGKFLCPECGKDFTKRCSVNRHLLTHNPTRPLQCDFCSMSFLRPADRRKHLKARHNVVVAEKTKTTNIGTMNGVAIVADMSDSD
jgi:predicted RNA-binding Zn-ribbon protein involved in translation (DUF1610 family)